MPCDALHEMDVRLEGELFAACHLAATLSRYRALSVCNSATDDVFDGRRSGHVAI